MRFSQKDTQYKGEFAVGTKNKIEIDKSKLSPLYRNIDFKIDLGRGGYIDSIDSAIDYCLDSERSLLYTSGNGWYRFQEEDDVPFEIDYEEIFGSDIVDEYFIFKNKRYEEFLGIMKENEKIYKIILTILIIEMFASVYEYQQGVMYEYKNNLLSKLDEIVDGESEEEITTDTNEGDDEDEVE